MLTSFLTWVLQTVTTAAEAERDDDTALREQLLETEMRREMGEITDAEFEALEADLLARIREIRERREGGGGPLALRGAGPIETSPDSRFEVEAHVTGDFHQPAPDAARPLSPPRTSRTTRKTRTGSSKLRSS